MHRAKNKDSHNAFYRVVVVGADIYHLCEMDTADVTYKYNLLLK